MAYFSGEEMREMAGVFWPVKTVKPSKEKVLDIIFRNVAQAMGMARATLSMLRQDLKTVVVASIEDGSGGAYAVNHDIGAWSEKREGYGTYFEGLFRTMLGELKNKWDAAMLLPKDLLTDLEDGDRTKLWMDHAAEDRPQTLGGNIVEFNRLAMQMSGFFGSSFAGIAQMQALQNQTQLQGGWNGNQGLAQQNIGQQQAFNIGALAGSNVAVNRLSGPIT